MYKRTALGNRGADEFVLKHNLYILYPGVGRINPKSSEDSFLSEDSMAKGKGKKGIKSEEGLGSIFRSIGSFLDLLSDMTEKGEE
jgi:hypothetical protein